MILRSTLDAEMMDATRAGVALQNKKAETLPVTQEEENKFWEMGLLGSVSQLSHCLIQYTFITESCSGFMEVNIEILQ